MSSTTIVAIAGLTTIMILSQTANAQSDNSTDNIGSTDVLQMAFEHNPALRSALLDEEQAAAAVRAESGLYPLMLQLDSGLTHSSSPYLNSDGDVSHRATNSTVLGTELSKTLPIGTQTSVRVEGNSRSSSGLSQMGTPSNDGPEYGLGVRLAVTQPLIRNAGTTVVKASLRQALKSEELQKHRTRRVASELVAEILDTYWELWYADRAVVIETRARDLAQDQLKEVEIRVAQGDSAPVDALPFQTRLATLEESVVSAQSVRDGLSVRLSGLIGFSTGKEHLTPDTDYLPIGAETSPEINAAVATALANSPEIREQLAAIEVAKERAKTAGEQLRPRLDLLGWLEANTLGNGQMSPVFQQFGDENAYSAYIGLLYELPLDDTRKKAQRAVANLDIDIASSQLLVTRDAVRVNVITVVEKISYARTRLELAERTLAVAKEQAEAERQRYNLGAAIFVQVREAEEAMREADLRTTRARVDLVQAELELDHLTGKLLDRYGKEFRAKTSQN